MRDDIGLLVLRLTGLYMALAHGWGKVLSLVMGDAERFVGGVEALGFPAPLVFAWAAALAEFAGGLGVFFGLYTRIAAAGAAFTMGVAGLVAHHGPQQWLAAAGLASYPEETLKGWGNPEPALIYFCAFVSILLLGPGRWSLDHWWRGKAKSGRRR